MLTDQLAVDIRQLQQFLAVIDCGSLGRASRHLGISEPALSKSIRRMEERLQVTLIDRTRRGVTQTPFGHSLAIRARFLITEWQSALGELGEMRGNVGGLSRAGTTFSYAAAEMATATSQLRLAVPNARAIVRQSISSELIQNVLDGSLDFALVTFEGELLEPDIIVEEVGDNPIVIAARTAHPLASRSTLHPADLKDCSWIVPRSREKLETLFTRHALGKIAIAAETSGLLFALSFMRQSDVLAYLPQRVLQQTGLDGGLTVLRVPEFDWSPRTFILRRRGATLSPTALTHLKLVKQAIESRKPPDLNSPA